MQFNTMMSCPFVVATHSTLSKPRRLPILSHADISNLVTLSALEFIPTGTLRTEAQGQEIHERVMKLQEDFLRLIGERLQVYKRVLRSEWRSSERQRQKFE